MFCRIHLISGKCIYHGIVCKSRIKAVLKTVTIANTLPVYIVGEKTFDCLAFTDNLTNSDIVVTVMFRPMRKCAGSVDVDCRWGGPECTTIVRYTIQPCSNLITNDNVICRHCLASTTNLMIGSLGYSISSTTRAPSMSEGIGIFFDERSEFADSASEIHVPKVFDAIDDFLSQMNSDVQAQFLMHQKQKYAGTKYDHSMRNTPWW